jgi:plasmid stability protein
MEKKTVKIDADLHSEVKVRVALRGGTVEKFVRHALRNWLNKTKPVSERMAKEKTKP